MTDNFGVCPIGISTRCSTRAAFSNIRCSDMTTTMDCSHFAQWSIEVRFEWCKAAKSKRIFRKKVFESAVASINAWSLIIRDRLPFGSTATEDHAGLPVHVVCAFVAFLDSSVHRITSCQTCKPCMLLYLNCSNKKTVWIPNFISH